MKTVTGTKPLHILILEDNRADQELSLRAFRDDPDKYRVSMAENLESARQILECDPPDLIIADWNLPDGNGMEILPRSDGMATIPLVIMTGYGNELLAVESIKSGAMDYVVKSAAMLYPLQN